MAYRPWPNSSKIHNMQRKWRCENPSQKPCLTRLLAESPRPPRLVRGAAGSYEGKGSELKKE